MAAKTAAERQKKYREKLKRTNPEKYEQKRIAHLEKVKENIRKKNERLTEKEKQEQIEKWRKANADRAEKRKKANTLINNDSPSTSKVIPKTESNIAKKKSQLEELIKENTELKRKNVNLKRQNFRYKRQLKILKQKLDDANKSKTDIVQSEATNNIIETANITPLTKTNSFLEDALPTISIEEKEKVKKKLLLLNTITHSLKSTYENADTTEKKTVLKSLATNETADKYKLKSKITNILGLKGRIRIMKAKENVGKKYKNGIQDFYIREDVSRPSAGKNECITRNKVKMQKRYMLQPIYKLYKKYRTEGGKASLQTFKRYRPFYVVKPRIQDRDTCACIKHSNISFKIAALKRLGVLTTTDIDQLMEEITCSKSFKCMYSECIDCKNKKPTLNLTIDANTPVQWLQWKIKTHTYTKVTKEKSEEKQKKKYSKEIVKGTVNTLVKEFLEDLEKFKIHFFNISHQYKSRIRCIEQLEDNEIAIICDFSENYSCKQAEEIQAVHFGSSRNQITLHTVVLYRKNEKPLSICSISPENEHGPAAIWAHLDPIFKYCSEKLKVKKIHIFSDSPATQYRQKNNFYMFQKRTADYGFEFATWNYSEAAHGKGPADGVGAAIKRLLDNHISHGHDITNAKEAFDYLKDTNTKVKVLYIPENDIQDMKKMIPNNIVPVKGTMKIHQIIIDGDESIKHKWLSCFECEKNICCNCYYKKVHNLIQSNTTNITLRRLRSDSSETLSNSSKQIDNTGNVSRAQSIGQKRHVTKNRKAPVKRSKRSKSSTSTTSDITISIHSDSDVAELAEMWSDEGNDEDSGNKLDGELTTEFKVTTNERNKEFRIDDVLPNNPCLDRITKEDDIQDSIILSETNTYQQTIKKKDDVMKIVDEKRVTILSSVKLTPENRAFIGLKTCKALSLKPISVNHDINIGKEFKENVKENVPSKSFAECTLSVNNEDLMETGLCEMDLDVLNTDEENANSEILISANKENRELPTTKYYTEDFNQVKKIVNDNNKTDKKIQEEPHLVMSQKNEHINNKEVCRDEQTDDEFLENKALHCGDTVLTRYFIRSWKYYVGVITEIHIDEKKYSISYYKFSGKKPNQKFIIPKVEDRDCVPEENIIKKIELRQVSDNPVQYVLMNDEDIVYF